MHVPLPDGEACARILKDCLTALSKTYPAIGKLIGARQFARCAAECVGLDGRAIRKMVANALANSPRTAMNPALVTIDDILAAVRAAKASRSPGGKLK
jgi:hypothetical protein